MKEEKASVTHEKAKELLAEMSVEKSIEFCQTMIDFGREFGDVSGTKFYERVLKEIKKNETCN